MNNNVNRKLQGILSKLSAGDLQRLSSLAKSTKLSSRLSENEKQKLLEEFSKLDSGEIKRKLSGLNTSELSKLSTNELIEKFRKL